MRKKRIFENIVYSYIVSSIIVFASLVVFCLQNGHYEDAAYIIAAGAVLMPILMASVAWCLHNIREIIDALRNPQRRIAGVVIIETNASDKTITIEEEVEKEAAP